MLVPMTRVWQAGGLICLCTVAAWAEKPGSFDWEPQEIRTRGFSPALGMLASEREDFATNLADHAASRVAEAKASPASLMEARHLLGVALHLSPRNKRAVVVNFQLGKGLLPEVSKAAYSAQAFSRLLLTRGQLLAKEGGGENSALARMFIQLAADMDPRNEEAVFASEMQRLDHGRVDWSQVTGGKVRSVEPSGQTP